MKIGIIGLPNVGKSTLFQALTKKEVDISNYPFCTIEPNVGVVAVSDERLEKLAIFFHSKKVVPAIIEFVDIAGLVRRAAEGEGLGNKFLSHIRDVDAILSVVRIFENSDITHVEKTIDPLRDIDIITTELLLKDLETVQKRREKTEKDARSGSKDLQDELRTLKDLEGAIQSQKTAYRFLQEQKSTFSEKLTQEINSLHLLTSKPELFAINSTGEIISAALQKKIAERGGLWIVLNIKEELDSRMFTEKERGELGIGQSKLDSLITKSYELLNLITFLTTGEDETRAWTIVRGTRSPQAAGVIHSDFEKKFIRADVIPWNDLLAEGGFAAARAKGLVRAEGRDYEVKDGDVVEVKHG